MAKIMAIAGKLPCKKTLVIANKEKCKDCPSFDKYDTIETQVDPDDPTKGYESRAAVVCNHVSPIGKNDQEIYDHLCSEFYGVPYEPPNDRGIADGDKAPCNDKKTAREKAMHPHYQDPDSPSN